MKVSQFIFYTEEGFTQHIKSLFRRQLININPTLLGFRNAFISLRNDSPFQT